ncbi:DUF5997 family protein [Pseudoclavibacter terrae]|uniref:Uncharacterized protein n=1 Tax=Pseudoclavibacter terrae TaxID=1530195 RepID=A0A7J5B3L1_9MICO|nr:DUF5997 family protein [Pseudoclavibacter terrae]KAB1638616.1 hypothetical protein F8O03_07675 [Pseudoclavibacter terrae]
MKPATAAKKLGIYLPAAPEAFQQTPLTRSAFLELQETPPEWLQELRRTGPHPRDVVARKLGITNSGLARGGVTEALTTAEIQALLEAAPSWLSHERGVQAKVRAENARVAELHAKRGN